MFWIICQGVQDMKEKHESIDAHLERVLQQIFRERHWRESKQAAHEEREGTGLSAESMQYALQKFDLRYAPKRPQRIRSYWTHPSVLGLDEDDPVKAITSLARQKVLAAMEAGWGGPPYDPFALAEHLGIRIIPTEDVIDARTLGSGGGRFTIEFNPSRPPARIRYSVAHEIAHTLFPDCAATIRNRTTHQDMSADEWQLEMLCNIAAAEILVPLGTLKEGRDVRPSVQKVIDLRKIFQVSFEAMLLRLIHVTNHRCVAFAARHDGATGRYKLDYSVRSATWADAPSLEPGFMLPKESSASECTAIEYTAKGEEDWLSAAEKWWVEYVGIPPYPGQVLPRVIGIVVPVAEQPHQAMRIKYVNGNAIEPRGSDQKLILQVVNDKAMIWGAGFSKQIRQKWPRAQAEFKDWVLSTRHEFKLGAAHVVRVDDTTTVVSLIAQHGYGPADHPRIRYNALANSLQLVGDFASRISASVHMPRIGSGLAGGSWEVVEEIVEDALCTQGLKVTVYDLPRKPRSLRMQRSLEFKRREVD